MFVPEVKRDHDGVGFGKAPLSNVTPIGAIGIATRTKCRCGLQRNIWSNSCPLTGQK
jgi:hypothetical protein